jgi:hypothetical protein
MDAQSAIRRLSFTEAQRSSAEAMADMARHRAELAHETEIERRNETQTADDFAERARQERRVDKTA